MAPRAARRHTRATTVDYDFLTTLVGDLAALGTRYEVVHAQQESERLRPGRARRLAAERAADDARRDPAPRRSSGVSRQRERRRATT